MVLQRPVAIVFATCLLVSFLICYRQLPTFQSSIIPHGPLESTRKPPVPAANAVPSVSRHLTVCSTRKADTSWIGRELPDGNVSIYVVDDPQAKFGVPQNKGRESMAYLTYIIDNYDNLADVEIFLHARQYAWHNNDLFDDDSAKVVKALSDAHVLRVGYLNLRCYHEPGCPDWLHIDKPESELNDWLRLEERYYTSTVWREMHGDAPIPPAISQPSGNQFAVSRDTIRRQPRSEYVRYRQWLLDTSFEDRVSGRIFEYIWHYIFTGKAELCPPMNLCYCEGFGVCFGGPEEFDIYFQLRTEMRAEKGKAEELSKQGAGASDEAIASRNKAQRLDKQMYLLLDAAFIRGEKPENRAKEGGRAWTPEEGLRI